MRQYRDAKEKHPDGILLFRLGDFYEIFFDDAKLAAPIMGVQLTSRPLGKSGRAPMCGVPHHAWQAYVGKLLHAGHKVVICDQIEAASKNKIVRRDVTRVLTPGTVVEDAYLEPSRHNYLVAAWSRGLEAGIAACEVSTGELLLCQLPKDRLQSELERLAPAELLSPPEIEEYRFDPVRGQQRLKDILGIAYPASVGAQDAPLAVGAVGVVLDYLKQNQTKVAPGSFTVRTYSPDAPAWPDGVRAPAGWLGERQRDGDAVAPSRRSPVHLELDPEVRLPREGPEAADRPDLHARRRTAAGRMAGGSAARRRVDRAAPGRRRRAGRCAGTPGPPPGRAQAGRRSGAARHARGSGPRDGA